ncbi:MAG: tRNA (adenosine(37)-N6)-dimethylallyltransferase MiaA [Bacteroidota bacterium]|jgi:tRNA dimethylallyltransferase
MSKNLIIIAGPTAVGKTDLCVKIAKLLDTEVVSADSRQFYRELAIGTAKPSTEEMDGVKHHFVDSHSIQDYYSVGDFERDCLAILEEIFQKKDVAILTGGSGMFIKMITDGIDEMPEADLVLRKNLAQRFEKEGLEVLANELKQLDPIYYEQVDIQNTQRVLRALEVCIATGQPFSSFRKNQKVERPFRMIKIGLERQREELYARIDKRMDIMLASGLEVEAKSVIDFREHYALKTVGYREIYEHLDGEYDREEMVRLLKRNSRRYAKRQMTWFKNQDEFHWFDAKNEEDIIAFIKSKCNTDFTD